MWCLIYLLDAAKCTDLTMNNVHCKGQNEKMMACLICLLTRWTSYVAIWGFACRREIMLDTQRHFTEMGKWHVESGSA